MKKFNVDDLIEQGLVKKKTYTEGKYKGLSVLKYTRKVFYDNLWHLDERLLECRGIVVDEEDNVIIKPFTKCFNYLESGCCIDVEDNHPVVAVEKINGFLGVVTLTKKYGLIVSTTGTLDSDYALLAKDVIFKANPDFKPTIGYTHLFEICDDSDPHIVSEDNGAHLIGIVEIETGKQFTETSLDNLWIESPIFDRFLRPRSVEISFKEAIDLAKGYFGEGYMILDKETGQSLCKVKSNFYLSNKALQRVGRTKVSKMWNNPELFRQQLDEEFYNVFDAILDTFTQEEYLNLTEQERRKWIENYFEEGE